MTDRAGNVKKEDLVVTRIIDAPLEMVWKAWTDPEHVMRWWGPKDWTSPSLSESKPLNVRRYCLISSAVKAAFTSAGTSYF